MGRGMGAGKRVYVRLQLQASAELRLPSFPRGSVALQGQDGAADEETEDAVWVLRAGGSVVSVLPVLVRGAALLSRLLRTRSTNRLAPAQRTTAALTVRGKAACWPAAVIAARTRGGGRSGAASSARDFGSGDDGCSDGGRFAALWVEDERQKEKAVRGVGLLGGEANFRFDGGKTRRERAAEERAAAAAEAAQEEAALAAALAAAQGEAACEPEARGRGQTAGARD